MASTKISLTDTVSLRNICSHMAATPRGQSREQSLKDLVLRHRFRPGDNATLPNVTRRWRASLGSKAFQIISYNTYLMDVTINVYAVLDELLPARDFAATLAGALIGTVTPIGPLGGALIGLSVDGAREILEENEWLSNVHYSKPACPERASELGRVIKDREFDLAVLSEVWNAQLAHLIEVNAGGANPKVVQDTAGLMTISPSMQIVDTQFHAFVARGKANMDADYYASKGVLLTRLQHSLGQVDLYSTHLYYGGDLPAVPLLISQPTNEDRTAVRAAQIAELIQFVKDTHRPENIALVMGDFNIDGFGDPTYRSYDDLVQQMASIGMRDQFEHWRTQFSSPNPEARTEVGANRRIDHVFVEDPASSHTFNLDLTSVSLEDFPRPKATEGQSTLSDHRALVFTMLCSDL